MVDRFCRRVGTARIFCGALALFVSTRLFAQEDRLIDKSIEPPTQHSADWAETVVPPPSPPIPQPFGPIAPAARQPAGALSGRIIFMNAGHGWIFDPDRWRLQRGVLNEMNEDAGNIDQLNFFAAYCFNAGAVIVPFRPLGQQTNEVILDNDDPGVTFIGSWANSTSTIFYGSPGDVPYRYASFATLETATATYTPNLPAGGYYPVYTWVRHGSDRGDQLYRIRHTGGESQVRIPHHMVGNGWVYLGEYYFDPGQNPARGCVIISNLRGSATGQYVFADAIRFGNGMGSVNRGTGVSGYPREDESSRYWIQTTLGQGQSSTLYDGGGNDESDSWSAPPKMSAEMNREEAGSFFNRIHISFHSNAGGGRGALGLITGNPTTNQSVLAQLGGAEINADLLALGAPPLEVPWVNRTTSTFTGGYSEIDGSLFNYEMDATILEVAFHDDLNDARLMRDSKARAAIGKAAMHAVVKYMNQFAGVPLNFLPEPPMNVRATGAPDGSITLRWNAPGSIGGSGAPNNYVIYQSTNGYGFGNPITTGNVTSYTIANLAPGMDYYFRVAATNAGGESLPSEVVGCRAPAVTHAPRALVVNGFDRFDRTTNLRQDVTRQAYSPPDATGAIERVWPRRVNAFDYVVPHGHAISDFGMAFDSCQNEAVATGQVALTAYPIVIWAAGQESTVDETFSATEQSRVAEFRNAGGNLFVSGSEIAWDLDRAAGPTSADRLFLNEQLKVDFPTDANDNAQSYSVTPTANGIFRTRSGTNFDNGANGIYWVQTPDVLTPFGAGATAALNYAGAPRIAAIQYDGSAGGGKVVYLGFPFETITSATRRIQYMQDVLGFFTAPETLVATGSSWKIHDAATDPGIAWHWPTYDDSAWRQGPAQLGFGEGDEATPVANDPARVTTYFRRPFNVADARRFRSLMVRLLRDDGAVVYLNGIEVVRSNLPPNGPIYANTGAVSDISGTAENAFVTYPIDARALRTGTNVLAVEVHQFGVSSDDLSFDLELTGDRDFAAALVMNGATWKFRDNGAVPESAWMTPAYNDAAWSRGPARLGYGGDGEVTPVSYGPDATNRYRTTWLRHAFNVTDASVFGALRVELQRDDGAIVYLNGVELLRDNLPSGKITDQTLATMAISGTEESAWRTYIVPASALVSGNNVVAAEVHQSAPNSSDLGFDLRLLGVARGGVNYSQWTAATFGSDATNPTVAGETADPHGNGVVNVVAYALGADVRAPDGFLPQLGINQGSVALLFTRNTLATDASIVIEGANALDGPWEALARSTNGNRFDLLIPGVTVNEAIGGGMSHVQITDVTRVDDPQHAQRFLRLRITRN
jgi:hypothetical protein